ncbi:MAG: hypothetical protein JWM95_2504 [Gemmatimonadetes bacterium]|nr:hypothetical protein [Gemmatimonadota bacterium]
MRLRLPIVCALAAALSLACGGSGTDTGGGPTNTTPVVRAVSVAPTSVQVELGATTTLVVDVRDQFGAAMTGKTATWSSFNTLIATVDAGGVVRGIAVGSTTISALVDGQTGLALVTVVPLSVASVSVTPAAAPVAIGAAPALSVTVKDKNGGTLAGRTVTWSSSNVRVATVSAVTGAITALSAGTTTITALSEGVSGTAVLAVAAPAGSSAPAISSISPATLVGGATATIIGTNLTSGAGASVVFVAGVPAAVTSATATQILATVPAAGIPCQSSQAVSVEVTTVAGTAARQQPMSGATSRPLAVGQSFIATASGNVGCNELPSAGAYLISVFNAGTTLGQAAGFELKGSTGGALASRFGPIAAQPVLIAAPHAAARSQVDAQQLAETQEHLEHMEVNRELIRQLGSPRQYRQLSRAVAGVGSAGPSRVPVPTTVGQTAQMNYHFNSCTAANGQPLTARVVYVGPRVIVMEDNAGPLAGKIDADMITMAQEFETVSFPILTANFGDPLAFDAQTDANNRLIMLFTPKVNTQSSNLLGFVSSCDFYPPSLATSVSGSNQAEIFYARAVTDTTATSSTLDSRNTWRRLMPATLIHETKHIVSYAERFQAPVNVTDFEQVWLEEATAQLAAEMYARVAHGNGWKSNATYFGTLDCEVRPNTANCGLGVQTMASHFGFLTEFLQSFEGKTILSGTDDNDIYGSSWMFTRWLTDTYGGTDEGAFIKRMVHNYNVTGVANATNVTGKTWPELLGQFTLMLAADDLAGMAAPYSEASWNLPGVFTGRSTDLSSHPSATPLVPRTANSGAFTVNVASLKGGGAMLLKLTAVTAGAPQLIDLHDVGGAKLASQSNIGIAVLRIQ